MGVAFNSRGFNVIVTNRFGYLPGKIARPWGLIYAKIGSRPFTSLGVTAKTKSTLPSKYNNVTSDKTPSQMQASIILASCLVGKYQCPTRTRNPRKAYPMACWATANRSGSVKSMTPNIPR
jgi:hypothetical protein